MEELRLVALGAGGVGKSATTIYFVQGLFVEEYDPTIEDSFRQQITLDGAPIMVDILDTAGEEEYDARRDHYVRMAHGFLVIYSITSQSSFDEVQTFIEQILRAKDRDYFPMVIVGNKCDLELERQVETQAGENFARAREASFFETSAKFGINVDEAIGTLSRDIIGFREMRGSCTKKKSGKKQCAVH